VYFFTGLVTLNTKNIFLLVLCDFIKVFLMLKIAFHVTKNGKKTLRAKVMYDVTK